jgi:hypothetical protein
MYKAGIHLHYEVCNNFMAMPFKDASFDDAHSSKVTCHMCSSLVAYTAFCDCTVLQPEACRGDTWNQAD